MIKKILLPLILFNSFLYSQGVSAGTEIKNIAEMKYTVGSQNYNIKSNELINIVDQVIELTMACQLTTPFTVQAGELDRALPIIIENTGNGDDIFNLTKESDVSSDVINKRIYLDDGDGIFNSSDVVIVSVNLKPDEKKLLFFVSDIPNSASWALSKNGIKAISNTGGSGIRGTIHPLPNFFAVDGYKGGVDSSLCEYELNDLKLILKKSSVSAGDIYKGSRLTYTINVSVTGTGTVENIIINDSFPIGTTYVPDTIFLDGVKVSDSSGIIGNKLNISLANMVSGNTHKISFDVIVIK